jgi:hypothetical protein
MKASVAQVFERPDTFELGSLSDRGCLKVSPLVEGWIGVCRSRSSAPQCLSNYCFDPSSIDALVRLIIPCWLWSFPVWQSGLLARILRFTVIPQRWPACWYGLSLLRRRF